MKLFSAIVALGAGCFLFSGIVEAKPRSCRLVYPERPRGAPKFAFLFDGEKSQRAVLSSMNLSPVVELPKGDLTIALTSSEVVDPESLSPETPKLRVPEGVDDFYILITPDPKNAVLPVKMNLVDPGGGKLKPSETLWFNSTPHQIEGKLGNSRLSVKPRGRAISKSPVTQSGYYKAEFVYKEDGEGSFAPITEQSWWHDVNSRHLGFIVNTGGRLPKLYFFRDFRPPTPPPDQAVTE